jgi:superfamily II DNA or RNA helicase
MPLFRNSVGPVGFKSPRLSTEMTPRSESAPPLPSPPAPRVSLGGTFKAPKLTAADPNVALPDGSPAKREVSYPSAAGRHVDRVVTDTLTERMKKLGSLDYHAPASSAALKPKPANGNDDTGDAVMDAGPSTAGAAAVQPGGVPLSTELLGAPEQDAEPDDATPEHIDSRLPPSARGRIYFQVTVQEGVTKHDATAIIIVDVMAAAVQMYDRVGRQFGNRPEPGYPLKPSDVDEMKAGSTIKVGPKSVTLVTALHEDAFRSGEFFLRKEHDQRLRDEKKREREAAAAVLMKKVKMTLGGGGFQSVTFRKRPAEGQSGFVVPLMGRIKGDKKNIMSSELVPLHDPDRSEAVVLFRADYKRDVQGQRIVSVVVDPVVGDKLRPHQRIGVQFLYDCVTGARIPGYYGAILADEMGLGKTVQTVATVWTCLRQGKFGTPVTRKAIVVAPSSLVSNWCNEFEKWIGPGVVKTMAIAESTPKGDRILSRFESEGDVLVISYDQLRKYIDRLATVRSVDLVVCDEGHRLKNAEIKTSKAVDALPTRRRIVLSGTPIQNDLAEFHAMVGFCNPGILGNMDLFKRVFEEAIMRGRDPNCEEEEKDLGRDRAHYLANLTKKFILRRTQTINEKYLPPKVDMTVFVRLGDEQRATYQRISSVASEFQSAPLVLITALKKLCNHMDLLHDAMRAEGSHVKLPKAVLPKSYKPGNLSFTYGAKLSFVSLMLDELVSNGENDKLVIVSNFTQTLTIIAKLCESKRVAFYQLDGSTPIKRRQELVDRFNVPSQREIVFLLSSKAGGVGLNLIGANRLILFDPDWNPANDAQAMGRVWRDGQKKRVYIYRLLSTGTIEEKVYQRQVSKQGLSANVVDMQDDSKQHFTADELRALFTYRPDTVCDTHDLLGCKCHAPQQSASGGSKADGAGAPKMQFKRVGDTAATAKVGGPRMDELKGWDHVADASRFALDKVLRTMAAKNKDLVSFLFANERDAQKLTGPQITSDRPFVADEGEITCASQVVEEEEPEIAVVLDDEDAASESESD